MCLLTLHHYNMHNSNSEHNSTPVAPVISTDTTATDVPLEHGSGMPATAESKPVKSLNVNSITSDSGTGTGTVTTNADDSKGFKWWGKGTGNKVCAQRF
jgi:hypothetical protein